jgi:hypothetical protein
MQVTEILARWSNSSGLVSKQPVVFLAIHHEMGSTKKKKPLHFE